MIHEENTQIAEDYSDFFLHYAFVTAIADDEPRYEGYLHFMDNDNVTIEEPDGNWSIIKYRHIKIINIYKNIDAEPLYNEFYGAKDYKGILPKRKLDDDIGIVADEYQKKVEENLKQAQK